MCTTPVPGPWRVVRLQVRVENLTPAEPAPTVRDEALPSALVAAHLILTASGGEFISMTDPPEWAKSAVAECENVGSWPVLADPDGGRQVVLSSPIILYDHPELAPESPGELYDGTEIDEILTLRTLALSDEEKREARATDPRAAALIDRVESLDARAMQRLHGTIRAGGAGADGAGGSEAPGAGGWAAAGYDPAAPWWDPEADASVSPETDSVLIGGQPVARGSLVRLRPGARRRRRAGHVPGRADGRGPGRADRRRGPPVPGRIADRRPRRGPADRARAVPVLHARRSGALRGGRDLVTDRILVAGVGNVFLRDDAFGVEVARLLAERPQPPGVQVRDYGIRGVHLVYELLNGYDLFVLVDAAPRGEAPGTVTVLEVDVPGPQTQPVLDAHSLTPDAIFGLLSSLGGHPGRSLVVACEPADIVAGVGLSDPVRAALPHAVRAVEEILAERPAGEQGAWRT